MTRRTWITVAVSVALLLGAFSAHAAQLRLTSTYLTTYSHNHPCPGTASTTPASGSTPVTAVTVTMPSASCSGLTVQLTLLDPTGAVVSHGSGVVTGSTATVSMSAAFDPQTGMAVQGAVNGWNLPLTWSYTAPDPVYQGNTPTTLTQITWTLVTNNPVQACFTATVTTTSTAPVEWRVTLDLAQAPFNGASPGGFSLQGSDSWRYQWYQNTPAPGFLQIGGTASGGRATITAGASWDVQVCNWHLPPGVQTPSAYTVTTARTTWTAKKACLATTVTGNGTERFYFGWTALVDMRPAVDRLAQAGNPLSAYSYSSNNWMLTRTSAPDVGVNVFRVTSNTAADLAGSQSITFETCANSW